MSARARASLAWLLAALTWACGVGGPDRDLLRRSWEGYRRTFITADGRVVRPEHGNDTVSEGQAYAMLRAAWMNDQATFDRVWRWTRTHLTRTGRAGASLLAWHWTPAGEGRVDDWNAATDADSDVALALLLAAGRWRSGSDDLPPYRDAAIAIARDLLAFAVVDDDEGRPVMLPGTWADQRAEQRGLVLNPSYFAPATYRLFHRTTGDARWLSVAAGTYDVLDTVCDAVGTDGAVVPDWIRWRSTREWSHEPTRGGGSGWDAVRVPWRIATDWLWFAEPRGRAFLDRCLVPFVRHSTRGGRGLSVERTPNPDAPPDDDHPLANALFAFALGDATERDSLLARVRARLVTAPDGLYFGDRERYYVNSLAYLPYLARAGRMVPPHEAPP